MRISFRATDDCRCDHALSERLPDLSRTHIRTHITNLTVNGLSTKLSHRVRVGDMICATIVEQSVAAPTPCYIPFDVFYEDDYVLVINKPDNISVHPGAHHALETPPTIVQGLHYRYPQLMQEHADGIPNESDSYRAGIVHRLDKNTSGLLMLAKRKDAIEPLQMLFRKRVVKKWYLAIVKGFLESPIGTFEDTLIRHPVHRQRFTIGNNDSSGKYAKTDYHCLWNDGMLTVVVLRPHTGRTHQLRVQLAARHAPVVGDDVYGRAQPSLTNRYHALTDRMYLHAIRLEFSHPFTNQRLRIATEVPPLFRQLMAEIRSRGEATNA